MNLFKLGSRRDPNMVPVHFKVIMSKEVRSRVELETLRPSSGVWVVVGEIPISLASEVREIPFARLNYAHSRSEGYGKNWGGHLEIEWTGNGPWRLPCDVEPGADWLIQQLKRVVQDLRPKLFTDVRDECAKAFMASEGLELVENVHTDCVYLTFPHNLVEEWSAKFAPFDGECLLQCIRKVEDPEVVKEALRRQEIQNKEDQEKHRLALYKKCSDQSANRVANMIGEVLDEKPPLSVWHHGERPEVVRKMKAVLDKRVKALTSETSTKESIAAAGLEAIAAIATIVKTTGSSDAETLDKGLDIIVNK